MCGNFALVGLPGKITSIGSVSGRLGGRPPVNSWPASIAGVRMLKKAIVRTVDTCVRHPWLVVLVALVLSGASAVYVARNFAITTNIAALISSNPPSRQRQSEYNRHFPVHSIIAVV